MAIVLFEVLKAVHHSTGVPRVLDKTLPDHFKASSIDPHEDWEPVMSSYLETTRYSALSIDLVLEASS